MQCIFLASDGNLGIFSDFFENVDNFLVLFIKVTRQIQNFSKSAKSNQQQKNKFYQFWLANEQIEVAPNDKTKE